MDLTGKTVQDKGLILSPWRLRLHEIIFESDTAAGKAFDVALLWAIIFSVIAVMLESVRGIEVRYGAVLRGVEWFFTIIFTVEYLARIISVGRPFKYMVSFLGIIDLLAVIPTYLSIFVAGTQFFLVLRTIRLLRVFRIFKLARFLGEADVLMRALKASRFKITVFLGAVLSIVIITGTAMYLIEGNENGFTSIPMSIYWAIVTLTTVGYGDIAPRTVPGQVLASLIMIMGYAIIAVPTGIVTVELAQAGKTETAQACPACSLQDHDHDAVHCKHCGARLDGKG
jgi:voltage-gated potassium channel